MTFWPICKSFLVPLLASLFLLWLLASVSCRCVHRTWVLQPFPCIVYLQTVFFSVFIHLALTAVLPFLENTRSCVLWIQVSSYEIGWPETFQNPASGRAESFSQVTHRVHVLGKVSAHPHPVATCRWSVSWDINCLLQQPLSESRLPLFSEAHAMGFNTTSVKFPSTSSWLWLWGVNERCSCFIFRLVLSSNVPSHSSIFWCLMVRVPGLSGHPQSAPQLSGSHNTDHHLLKKPSCQDMI